MEVFNEMTIFLASFFLILFTETNVDVKKSYGWGLSCLTLVNLAINLTIAFAEVFVKFYKKVLCKIKQLFLKAKKPRKTPKEPIESSMDLSFSS